jgi:DNA repair protein RadD
MYKPYPIQQLEIDKITEFIKKGTNRKAVFAYPVSFGKTILIANVAINFPNKYFINVAPNKELVEQNHETYTSYGYDASICSASLNSNEVSQVTFATIGTLKKHIDFFKDKDVILLQDEAHDSSLKKSEIGKFYKQLKKCKLLGFTATPMRLNNSASGTKLSMMNRQKDCIYSSIESVIQVSDVIDNNMWSKLVYDVENVDESKLKLNTTGSDYTLKSLEAFSEANNIVQKCVESVYRLREEDRESCIVYVTSIDEAERVASKIEDSAVLHSKLKKTERDRVITEFKAGNIKTVVNVGILKQGFNYPELSSIVFARPTNSYTLYYQVLGRVIRKHEDKIDGKVIDISGNYNKFGAIEDLEFINEEWCGGWAAFSGNRLLTGYALGGSLVPTKQSLKHYFNEVTTGDNLPKDPKFNFGKHKGVPVSVVKRKHESYLFWIVDPETKFTFRGKNGLALKRAIYRQLKLPLNKLRDVDLDYSKSQLPFNL